MPCPSDSPVLNLSAEASDGPSFIGIDFDGQNSPPIGTNWGGNPFGGPGVCVVNTSQTESDQCGQRHQVEDGPGHDWTPKPVLYGNTPQQCSISCPDGLPFIYTVTAGTYLGVDQIIVDRIAHSYACQLAFQNKVCLSSLQDHGCLNEFYSDTIIPLGTAPFTFSIINGGLPPGLNLTQSETVATISGTPTTAGVYTFQIQVVDGRGNFMRKTFRIDVIGISNTSLPDGSTGTSYSQQLTTVGGTAPFTFEVTDGALPDGLTMDVNGLISGTPTTVDTFDFTVTFDDANGNECDQDLSIIIAGNVGPDWSMLVWAPPDIEPNSGIAIGNFPGGPTYGLTLSNTGVGGGGALNDVIIADASLLYTGPNANCRLKLTITNTIHVASFNDILLFVQQDGGTVLSLFPPLSNWQTLGVFNFDFPLIAGVNSSITIHVEFADSANFAPANSLSFSATMSNI